ncbi:MAG: hypothetical protein II874_04420 [Bacteroidales bacterium]|nr:hypothetical protein [Bacteroidales bacterium]
MRTTPDMKIFEHKHISCSLPSGLDGMMKEVEKLGKQGWELVSVCPTMSSQYGMEQLTAFLKRELS